MAYTKEEFADLLICPISKERMINPVTDICGHTFELNNIKKHLDLTCKCPISRLSCKSSQLVPNYVVKSIIDYMNYTEAKKSKTIKYKIYSTVKKLNPFHRDYPIEFNILDINKYETRASRLAYSIE